MAAASHSHMMHAAAAAPNSAWPPHTYVQAPADIALGLPLPPTPTHHHKAHVGPIISLERSPFFDDVVLTCGDWQWQVWREGGAAASPSPLFQSGYAADYYTAAAWSPTRPGVAYLADQTGALEVWDLLDRSHEPSLRVQVRRGWRGQWWPGALWREGGGTGALAGGAYLTRVGCSANTL